MAFSFGCLWKTTGKTQLRLQKDGYVIYTDRYELEDPFFRAWLIDNE